MLTQTHDPIQALTKGFRPLPLSIQQSLDEEGYVILYDMADPAWLAEVKARLDELVQIEGDKAAREHHQEEGVDRLANLVNKGKFFQHAWCHPLILACCDYMYKRPFKLSSLNGREAHPGGGHQPLHGDWKPPRGNPLEVHVTNGLWAIDDLTKDNGAPRLVPRSHLLPGRPEDLLDDVNAPHPDEIVAEVPAGSVVMINAHTWHGGRNNINGRRRRVLHAYYTAREHPQQQCQRKWVTEDTRSWLTGPQGWLLDVE